jgi:hypothetical protein
LRDCVNKGVKISPTLFSEFTLKMSSDIASANGKKKTKKLSNSFGNSSSNEIISASLTTSKSQNNGMRIGPRVFKCVILGDGGVGKSGKSIIRKKQD